MWSFSQGKGEKRGLPTQLRPGTTGRTLFYLSSGSAPSSSLTLFKFLSEFREIIHFTCATHFLFSFKLLFEWNGYLLLCFETERMEACGIFSLYLCIIYAFHHRPYYHAHPEMNYLIYFFFPHRAGFFPRPLIILITLSKAPFKSVLILFFRWGENHCGIRRHHFNNVIIFILLFPILFTNHTNILFVSLPILPFFPGSLLPADWAADTDAVVSSLVNIAN